MKLLLATPLYPPDIAMPAPYVKELARRLVGTHEVTILTYGNLPERIPGVRIIPVNAHQPLLMRLFSYAYALVRATPGVDMAYLVNGASAELPGALVLRFLRKPYLFCIADRSAHERATRSKVYGGIERLARSGSRSTIQEIPPQKPEILPFTEPPIEALAAYEEMWTKHLDLLASKLS